MDKLEDALSAMEGNMALRLGRIEQHLDSLEQLVSSKMASNSNKRGPTVPYISNVIRPVHKSSIIFSSYYLMYGFEFELEITEFE